ncbi:MAG: apolipoprotein A1/A4/E family protein [Gemmataceae bacterium]|nr:apolipoprotein A1/A4/E family protein [Gemmataceae bacterium]MCI0740463.1 apolipoprotein A1/A4/E family protein [Gemmataceae bacterium]
MRAFIVLVVLLVAVIGIAGFALGWFNFSTSTHDGKTDLTVTVDPNKIKQDRDTALGVFHTSRDEFQKKTETRLQGMERGVDELKAKAKTAGAETKDQMNEAITELGKKTQTARAELKELGDSTKEGYDAIKTRLSASMNDLQGGIEKANTRFQ